MEWVTIVISFNYSKTFERFRFARYVYGKFSNNISVIWDDKSIKFD